ncbi:hypothetical protein ACERZ8_16535 [Tateyamaria armeniaca]|uniref:Uncharacterized protein n=1 Tax=Tateyamaria armeniaca TaxID=2518930 RepID=A0ABW8UXC4_9RHOB
MTDLDARLLAAHAAGDRAVLVTLYQWAADAAETDTARGFYLTHAHVFAMEIDHPDTACLRAALIDMGRETPL